MKRFVEQFIYQEIQITWTVILLTISCAISLHYILTPSDQSILMLFKTCYTVLTLQQLF